MTAGKVERRTGGEGGGGDGGRNVRTKIGGDVYEINLIP